MTDQAVILLAEDQEDDVFLIKKAFERGGIKNPFFVVRNGDEAIAWLKGEGKFSNRRDYPFPDLLLLDLKMPGADGFEVLRWLRKQPDYGNLLVVVLTSSNQIRDVNQAYKLGANSFLVKPMDFDNYVQTCHILKEYWLHLNKTPTCEPDNIVTLPASPPQS